MKRVLVSLMITLAVATGLILIGCDWSSNTDSFNTSQGAGATVNWSGVYTGNHSDGDAVSDTSGGPITRLVIAQNGNSVEVTDNNGSRYVGSVGSPGVVSDGSDGTFTASEELVASQISFAGKDEISGKDIEFVGVLHAVAVTDITGDSRTTDNTSGTTSDGSSEVTTVNQTGTNQTIISTTVIVTPVGTTEITTIEEITPSGQVLSSITTTNVSSTVSTTTENTYRLTEQNTQYRLEGTWVEIGGKRASVDALSAGASGTITSSSSSSSTTTTGSN